MKPRNRLFALALVWLLLVVPARAVAQAKTIEWGGTNYYLLGANYPWWNYGTDFGTGGWGKYTDWNAITADFQAMNKQGVRVVRWWVFSDGRYSPDFNANGTVAGLDVQVLPNIDRALQIAAANDIYLLLTLIDNSIWSPAVVDGSVQSGGHAAMITNATVQQSYLDKALKPLLLHIAASANKKYVLGYDIVNEPEGNMAGYWGGANLSRAAVQTFVSRCAAYIHAYGGGGYATVGAAKPGWASNWTGLGLDFYQVHYYPGFDTNGPGSGLPTCGSLGLDRPCIVGEFATVDASYGLKDTGALSAAWYLNTIQAYGYAGALAWSYGADDNATDWASFQPVFSSWSQSHAAAVGPR